MDNKLSVLIMIIALLIHPLSSLSFFTIRDLKGGQGDNEGFLVRGISENSGVSSLITKKISRGSVLSGIFHDRSSKYLSYVQPRSISDLVFHYYTSFNESWMIYTPNLDVSKVYSIANALYNTYLLEFRTTRLAGSLFTLTYLSYTFNNQTFINETESYWDWLWEQGYVNHTTYFMKAKSDSSSAAPITEMWCLYHLWKLTGKQKFYGNLTNLIQKYESLVLKKIGYPLSTSLKTTLLLNSSGEYIIDVVNKSTEFSTWHSSIRSILIFLAEKNLINKTLVAESLHRLASLLWDSSKEKFHEAVKAFIYSNSGAYTYSITTYDLFASHRQHTQRVSAFIWANKTMYDLNTDAILKSLDLNSYYSSSTKTYRYRSSTDLLEQYGIAAAFAHYLLHPEVLWQAFNASIIQGLIGPKFPVGWYIDEKVAIQHARSIQFSADEGYFSSAPSTTEYKVYVNVYLHFLINILSWLSNNFWVSHNPHYYYATEILYTRCIKGDPPRYYEIKSGSWSTSLSFSNRHGFNLFVLFDGAHPNLTFIDIILAECNALANPFIVSFSSWGQPELGYGTFSVSLRNIYVPLSRTSYIFVPSKIYRIKAVKISNATFSKTFIVGGNNYTLINDSYGNMFLVSALPDNVVVFNPIHINYSKSISVFNITIDMLNYTPPDWYHVSYDNQISYAYWLCYTNDPSNLYSLDPDEDYDCDGVPTRYEVLFMSDPFNNDTDRDKISDAEEIYFLIDPVSKDSDCDGLSDMFEVYGVTRWSQYINHSFDPRNTHSYNSTYYDLFYGYILENQTPNLLNFDELSFNETAFRCSLDTDDDGLSNYREYYIEHTDPFEPRAIIIEEPSNFTLVNYSAEIIARNNTQFWFINIYANGSLIKICNTSAYNQSTKKIHVTITSSEIESFGLYNITLQLLYENMSPIDRGDSVYINFAYIKITEPDNMSLFYKFQNIVVKWNGSGVYDYFIIAVNDSIVDNTTSHNSTVLLDTGVWNISVTLVYKEQTISCFVLVIVTEIKITSPENGSLLLQQCWMVWVEWNTTAEKYVANISIYVNGTLEKVLYNYSNGAYVECKGFNKTWNITVIVFYSTNTSTLKLSDMTIFLLDIPENFLIITTPTNNSYINDTLVNITWTCMNTTILTPVFNGYIFNISINETIHIETNSTSIEMHLGDGVWNITIAAYTNYTNIFYAILIIIDTTPPIAEILNITINETYSGVIFFSTNTSDAHNYTTSLILLEYISGEWKEIEEINISWGLYNISFDTTSLMEGFYMFLLRAEDSANWVSECNITFYIDNTPPRESLFLVNSKILENGTYINNSKIIFSFSFYDLNITNISVLMDEQEYLFTLQNMTAEKYNLTMWFFNITLIYMANVDGYIYITIKAWDKENNIFVSHYFIVADIAPPLIEVLSPENRSIVGSSDILNISWKVFENISKVSVFIFINDSLALSSSGNGTLIIYPENMVDGAYIIKIMAVDGGGNSNTVTVLIFIDKQIDITLIDPINATLIENVYYSREISFDVKASDKNGIRNVSVYINDSLAFSGNSSFTFCVVPLQDGVYNIRVLWIDCAGNEKSIKITYCVDRKEPNVSLVTQISPDGNIIINIDDNLSPFYVNVSVNGNNIIINSSNSTILITGLEDGYHRITVSAIDAASNVISAEFNVTVDADPPEIYIWRLNQSALGFRVIDATLTSVSIIVDNITVLTGKPEGILVLEEGIHTINITAFSIARNTSFTDTFVSDKTPPEIIVDTCYSNGEIVVLVTTIDISNVSIRASILEETYEGNNLLTTRISASIPYSEIVISIYAVDFLGNEKIFSKTFVLDPDADGLNNYEEYLMGTDPLNNDTDNDGISDCREASLGTDPLNSDSDGDGIADGNDPFPLINNFVIFSLILFPLLCCGSIMLYRKKKIQIYTNSHHDCYILYIIFGAVIESLGLGALRS